MHVDFIPTELPPATVYGLLTATVVPRPIAWVSSLSTDGVANLAPHSMFTVSCIDPPIVQFTSVREKDTLRNVVSTGEFVVNFASEHSFDHINATATDYPPDVSEFDTVGVGRRPSEFVDPPRVAGSPIAMECRLNRTIPLGDSTLVLGDVADIAVDESVLDQSRPDRPHPQIELLRPLARLGKDQWSLLGEVQRRRRIPYEPVT